MNDQSPKFGLELLEDVSFEQREWKLQRIAWSLMAVLIGLGLIGLFGEGALSSRTVSTPDGALKLHYGRFERWQAPSTLQIKLQSRGQTRARLWIAQDFLDTVKIESIVPLPQNTDAEHGGTTYTFEVPGPEPLDIVFYMQTQKMGNHPIQLRANEGPAVRAPHWVYP
jgi:hypothetical protein